MKTALIILNYNSFNDLVHLVNQLIFSINKDKYSIIVIDNSSSEDGEKLDRYFLSLKACFIDGKPKFNKHEKFTNELLFYIRLKENFGYSRGNNVGLRLATNLGFQFGFIINPDIFIPDFKIFDDAASIFSSNKKIGIIGYRVILPNAKNQGPFKYKLGWDFILRNFFYPFVDLYKKFFWFFEKKLWGYITVPAVVGCFVGIDLKKMSKVGFYDENVFLYYEEYIISEKMRQNGFRTVYRDKYYINHNHLYENDNKKREQIEKDEISKFYYWDKYLHFSDFSKQIMVLSIRYRSTLKGILQKLKFVN